MLPRNGWLAALTAALVVTHSACAWETAGADPSASAADPCGERGSELVTFVHVSDLHGAFNPDGHGSSPVARIRGLYEQVREQRPSVVFTNGGDDHEKGSVVEQVSLGAATRDIIHALQFDVRVMGNHDFAWGVEAALAHARDPSAIVLASNVDYIGSDPTAWEAQDAAIVTSGCMRIGFFGLVSSPWDEQDLPVAEDYYPEMPTRLDFAVRAEEMVAQLRPQVDMVVLLSHLGLDEDLVLADRVLGIDVILGGHSHSRTEEPIRVGGGTLVVHPGAFGQSVAQLDVVVVPGGGIELSEYQLHAIDGATPVSEEVDAEVKRVIASYGDDTLGSTGWVKTARTVEETADVAARAAVAILDVQAAVVDKKTAWRGLPAGWINAQSFADSFPVERQRPGTPGFSAFYTMKMTGQALQELVAENPDRYRARLPEELQPHEVYDVALPKRLASRWRDAGFAAEAWQVLDLFVRDRSADCLYLDEDEAVPGCGPL